MLMEPRIQTKTPPSVNGFPQTKEAQLPSVVQQNPTDVMAAIQNTALFMNIAQQIMQSSAAMAEQTQKFSQPGQYFEETIKITFEET